MCFARVQWDNMKARTTNLLAGIIIAVACTQMFGYLVQSRNITLFGKSLMFTPLPTPFSAVRGYESLTSARTYTLHFTDGRTEDMQLDDTLNELLPGPHRRKIPYIQVLRLAPRLPQKMNDAVLYYLFCKSNVYDQYTSKLIGLDHISITIRHVEESRDKQTWEYNVRCSL